MHVKSLLTSVQWVLPSPASCTGARGRHVLYNLFVWRLSIQGHILHISHSLSLHLISYRIEFFKHLLCALTWVFLNPFFFLYISLNHSIWIYLTQTISTDFMRNDLSFVHIIFFPTYFSLSNKGRIAACMLGKWILGMWEGNKDIPSFSPAV